MNICSRFVPLLPLYAGGDLPEKAALEIGAHLATCPGCQSEVIEFKTVIAAARIPSYGGVMPSGRRRRIAEEAARRQAQGRWGGVLSLFPMTPSLRLVGGAAAAAVLLAVVALPIARQDAGLKNEVSPVTNIEVVRDGGVVRLAWHNGKRETYTVYKSNNPQEFSKAGAHKVSGNIWTDDAPESSEVVFYRIE